MLASRKGICSVLGDICGQFIHNSKPPLEALYSRWKAERGLGYTISSKFASYMQPDFA